MKKMNPKNKIKNESRRKMKKMKKIKKMKPEKKCEN